jgi:hypothetical protein
MSEIHRTTRLGLGGSSTNLGNKPNQCDDDGRDDIEEPEGDGIGPPIGQCARGMGNAIDNETAAL